MFFFLSFFCEDAQNDNPISRWRSFASDRKQSKFSIITSEKIGPEPDVVETNVLDERKQEESDS